MVRRGAFSLVLVLAVAWVTVAASHVVMACEQVSYAMPISCVMPQPMDFGKELGG